MHTIIETPTYLRQAKSAGADEETLAGIAASIAEDPTCGDVIRGTGGARKVRFASKGKGKRGSYRVIHYYAAPDVPVFLLAFMSKGQRSDISQAERNEFKAILGQLADAYRESVKAKIHRLRG